MSRAQITRLVAQHRRTGHIRDRRGKPPANAFARRYTTPPCWPRSRPSPVPPPRSSCGDDEVTVTRASSASLTSASPGSTGPDASPSKTRTRRDRSPASPGPTASPASCASTPSTSATDGRKGVYIINVVDEVTQFQHLGAAPRITQHFLVPVLEALLSAFPFTVQAFHADNGSEYVNHFVADLLPHPRQVRQRPRRDQERRRALGHSRPPLPSQRLSPTSAPSSTSTGPASSPPSAPTAESGGPTARMTSPPRTSTSDRCPMPSAS